MSKSHDDGALVVASLRFAAALLPPEVLPHDICTKSALSAIVLASHRVSQQATAQLKLTHVTDPRRLQAKLVENDLDDQLNRVAFADITWDSEGVASQTLEMELQDVEERASATLQRSVCVLICARDSSASEETAVVWFPHRREEDNNSDSKSHKYLLFVAPGRVKVVKSLSELMKKMHEEMAVLRCREATYRAWTLLDGPKRKREAKAAAVVHPKTKDETVTQHATSIVNSLVEKEPRRQKEETPEQEQAPLKMTEGSEEHRQNIARRPPPQRVHVRVVTEERSAKESMFAFSRVAVVESVESQQNQHDDKRFDKVASPVVEKVTSAPANEPVFEETTSQSPVRQPQRSGRVGVSASHATTSFMQSHSGEKAEEAVWRSVDGEIKRAWKAAKDQIGQDIDPSTDNDEATSRSCPAVEENAAQDPVETTAKRPARVRPYVSEKEPTETMFQFSSTRTVPSPPLTLTSLVPVALEPHHLESVVHRTPSVEDEDSIQKPEVVTQVEEAASSPVKKKRSARDHYRSKLGARVWWELEYQATKILQQGLRTERREDGIYLTNHASKKDEMQPRSEATAGTSKRPQRTADAKEQERSAVREAPLPRSAASVSMVRSPESSRGEIPTEIHTTIKSTSPVVEKNMIASCAPTSTRHAWDEPVVLVEKSLAKQEKLQNKTQTHGPASIVVQREVFADAKKLVASTVESGRAMINDRHRRSVDTRTAKIIEVAAHDEQSPPTKSSSEFTKADAPRAAVWPSPRQRVPASQVDVMSPEEPRRGKHSKVLLEPSPQYTTREALVHSQAQSSSGRFSARQSRVQVETEEEDTDSVLMATMGPRTQPPSQNRSGVSRQPLPEVFEAIEAEDLYTDETPPHHIPFNVHGRVPIRRPQPIANAVKEKIRDREDQDEDDEDQEIAFDPPSPLRPAPLHTKIPRNPHPMASFISVEPSSRTNTKPTSDEEATQRARQQKLMELRQKKLQQLQKARDSALNKKRPGAQQQHPQQQSSLSHPVTIVVPDAKSGARTAAPPPTTSAMDRSEAFPLTTTTTRTGHRPSNRQLIQNAIEYTLLAGGSLDKERQAALHALGESTCENFIVLLKSAKELKFRALYEHHMERGRIVKIYGVASSAPPLLTEDVISQFFRYNSGKKEFAPIDGRSFTVKTDACALVDQLVFKKKPLHRLL